MDSLLDMDFDFAPRTLIVLLGPPGAGKSTFAGQYLSEGAVVSPDSIRALAGELSGDQRADERVWATAFLEIEFLLRQGKQYVVLDATGAVKELRLNLISHMRSVGAVSIVGIFLATPLEVCLERNRSRERIVPNGVIERMAGQLAADPPSLHDGFDTLLKVTQ